MERYIERKNGYLREHPRASVLKAPEASKEKLKKLKLEAWVQIKDEAGMLKIERGEEALQEKSYPDGCYVIKTDLKENEADTSLVYEPVQGLDGSGEGVSRVQTVNLEVRPV